MAGVGGDALGGVDRGGVAEFDELGDVVGGQREPVVVAQVPDVDRAVAVNGGDLPAVAVADPGGVAAGEVTVVPSGDHRVPDTGLVAVTEVDLASGPVPVEPGGAGGGVEGGDLFAGGGEHERVQPVGAVGLPGGQEQTGGGVGADDVDALVVEVVAEGASVAGTEGEVDKLSIRSTTVRTLDDVEYIVPNQDWFNGTVKTFTRSNKFVRARVPIGIGKGADPRVVQQMLVNTAKQHPNIMTEPPPAAMLVDLKASAMSFVLLAWVEDARIKDRVVAELRLLLWDALKANGIELA